MNSSFYGGTNITLLIYLLSIKYIFGKTSVVSLKV